MNNPQYPTARKAGLVVQEVPDEVLVYDLDTNKAHCLNKTAAAVWRFCDGKSSVPEIAKFLSSEMGTKVDDDLVWLAIDQLNESSLLEAQAEPKFQGQSRRDAIRKIGIASMIALPIVASLVAPKRQWRVLPADAITERTLTVFCRAPVRRPVTLVRTFVSDRYLATGFFGKDGLAHLFPFLGFEC